MPVRILITFLIALAAAVLAASPEALAGPAQWHLLRQADVGQILTSVACPGARVCFAAGTLVLGTHDAGETWFTLVTEVPGRASGIACPATTTCYLSTTAGLLLLTRNGGTTWSRYHLSSRALGPVACPTLTVCYVVVLPQQAGQSDMVLVTNDGGSHWTPHRLTMDRQLAAIACPTKNTCLLVGGGYIVRTTDGGKRWSIHNNGMDTGIGTNGSEFTGVVCPARATCYTVSAAYGREWTGGSVYRTRDAGIQWTQVYDDADSTGQSGALLAIACTDTRTCYAVGENRYILQTQNAGVHWNKEPSGAQTTLDAISCRHGIACVAVGSSGTVVSN